MRMIFRALAFGAALLAGPAFAAQPITVATSPGGLTFWLVEERTIPMVALEIDFVGGAQTDPEDRLGVASFMAALLEEGAGDRDAVAFAEAAQTLAVRFGFDADRDALSVSARMLSDRLDASVALLADALNAPRFDPEPVERVRGQILSGLAAEETDPEALVARAFFAAAFPGDPYGRPTSGRPDTIASVTAEDLRAAHRRLLTRGGARIGVVGAIDAATAGAVLDRLLGGLPADAPAVPGPTAFAAAGGVEVVDLPAPQSTVMFGHAGPLRDDPDFMPLFVANYILGGGGFSSRLTVEVREKRGLAYSTYAYLAPFDRAGLWMGGVGTANARVAESIEVIRDEWRRMAEQGVTEEELRKAKQYLTGAYPLRFDSNAAIARNLVALQRDGLPADYPQTRNAEVEAVTAEDIRRVAARWLRPEALFFTVAGQPEGLTAGQ